ncbi:hypothetical protein QQ054_04665 [Oscillatoria amoena NRMC-F 0135]|nr:hypothetical protein [Oscillatoria amoena NRMC-F 0135]MDL5053506.1 hypothetical protein [Oscillatoria laete-virens NRMC-F 0139]
MSDPLDDELKKMKEGVPAPPDFLARVRAQIAREEAAAKVPPTVVKPVWWRSWADFFSMNPFPVAAAAALVIFSGAALVWKFSQPAPRPEQIAHLAGASESALAMQAFRDVPSGTDAARPEEVIVRIELLAEDQPMVAAAPAPLAQSVVGRSANTLAVAEASPGIAPGGCVVKPDEGKPGRAPGGCVVEHKETAGGCVVVDPGQVLVLSPAGGIQTPVLKSPHGPEETIRIVEQIARDYSVALVGDKLKDARRDLGQSSASTTVTLEIPTTQTNDFMIALQRAMTGGVTPPPAPKPAPVINEVPEKVQVVIEISTPAPVAAPQEK